jgi:ketosteroid isomerase-like protein
MPKRRLILPILFLSTLGCVSSPPTPSLDEIRLQVMAVETAFAETMADRDHRAFSTFIADDAVFFAGEKPLRGKLEVVAWWAQFYEASNAPFSWEPVDVEILDSGTLAHNSGPVYDASGKVTGQFNSIWRIDSDGNWRIIFDKGSIACNCAEE